MTEHTDQESWEALTRASEDRHEADAQALADVRTLDEWATPERHFRVAPTGLTTPVGQAWMCARMLWRVTYWLSAEEFFAPNPDAARHDAAEWVRGRVK
jgi:hypothetical protein